jgi:hypothetical protein
VQIVQRMAWLFLEIATSSVVVKGAVVKLSLENIRVFNLIPSLNVNMIQKAIC